MAWRAPCLGEEAVRESCAQAEEEKAAQAGAVWRVAKVGYSLARSPFTTRGWDPPGFPTSPNGYRAGPAARILIFRVATAEDGAGRSCAQDRTLAKFQAELPGAQRWEAVPCPATSK